MPGNRSEQVEHCGESSEAMHACEHETSAPSFKLNAFQIIEAVTAPPVAPCACHYNTATEPLSPRQSQRPVSRAG